MQWGHGPRRDPTPETVAEHQVISVAKLFEKRLQSQEVVAVVGVTHYHEPAARGIDTRPQRIAVTLRGHGYDACAITGRNRLRAVRATVIGDDHLTRDIVHLEICQCLLNAGPHRPRFVETGHDDRQFRRELAGCRSVGFEHFGMGHGSKQRLR